MPLFVFISGYLLANSLSKRSVSEVLNARVKSLFVPFVAWSILGIAVSLGLKPMLDGKIIICEIIDQVCLNPAVWFLWTLFAVAVLALFASHMSIKFSKAAHMLVCGVIIFFPVNQYAGVYYIQWFYIFFIAGFGLFHWQARHEIRYLKIIFWISLVVFIVLQSFWNKSDYIYINKMTFHSGTDLLRLLYRYLIGFLGIIVVLGVSWHASKVKHLSFLEKFGFYSLDIYLLQRFLLEGLYGCLIAKWSMAFDHRSTLFLAAYVPAMAFIFAEICIFISLMTLRKYTVLSTLFLGARR